MHVLSIILFHFDLFSKEKLLAFKNSFILYLLPSEKLFHNSSSLNFISLELSVFFLSYSNIKFSTMASITPPPPVYATDSMSIVTEYHFKFEVLKEYNLDVSKYVNAAGWDGLFLEKVPIYPNLIKTFWRKPVIRDTEITTFVLGKKVVVSKKTISEAIACAQEGLIFNENWEMDLGGSETIAVTLMKSDTVRTHSWKSSEMKDEIGILHQILNKTVLTKLVLRTTSLPCTSSVCAICS